MSNRHTTVKTRGGGKELALSQTTTDSPIIPVEQLERLHAFRPDKVDWIFTQTELESQSRRESQKQINRYIFIERILGQLFGLLIGLSGLGTALYAGLHGATTVGVTLAGGTLVALVSAFVVGKRDKGEK